MCGTSIPEGNALAEASAVAAKDLAQEAARADASAVAAKDLVQETAKSMGLLGPTIRSLRAAMGEVSSGAADSLAVVDRVRFMEGLDEFALVLDSMGGNMTSYLTTNIEKLKGATDSSSDADYRQWLLSELPAHVACKTYLDDSAWMGSEWVGYTLEFFAEFFAEVHAGKEAKQGAELAYQRTLANHHNFFQRTAFNVALRRLPVRTELLRALEGGGATDPADVLADIGEFVDAGRALAQFCLRCKEELQNLKKEGRKAVGR